VISEAKFFPIVFSGNPRARCKDSFTLGLSHTGFSHRAKAKKAAELRSYDYGTL